jgi:tetratricopeptide (TPR) repeat protein
VCLAGGLAAQYPRLTLIRGELAIEEGVRINWTDFLVEIQEARSRIPERRVMVCRDGSFELRDIEPGEYYLRVVNVRGEAIQETLVFLRDTSPLAIRIAGPGGGRSRPVAGTVSVRELQKGPGKGAAPNDRGARYMASHQYAQAAKAFREAIGAEPRLAMAHHNLSIALLAMGDYGQAEVAARRALELAPDSASARYAVGLSLLAQQTNLAEAVDHLLQAAPKFPRARLHAARTLAGQGNRQEAAAQLRLYLATANAADRPAVEAWLASLER